MWQHLREAHPSDYHEAKLPGECSLNSTDSTVTASQKPTDTSSSSVSNEQIQITEAFNRTWLLPHSLQ